MEDDFDWCAVIRKFRVVIVTAFRMDHYPDGLSLLTFGVGMVFVRSCFGVTHVCCLSSRSAVCNHGCPHRIGSAGAATDPAAADFHGVRRAVQHFAFRHRREPQVDRRGKGDRFAVVPPFQSDRTDFGDRLPGRPIGDCLAQRRFVPPVDDDPRQHRVIRKRCLLEQCEEVGGRLRKENLAARTVQLRLRYADFTTLTRRQTLEQPTADEMTLYEVAGQLLAAEGIGSKRIRLIGVGGSNLVPPGLQGDLFDGVPEKRARVNKVLDELRGKLGPGVIRRGTSLR